MKVITLSVGPLATNCYIAIDGSDAIVVDPGAEGERILAQVGKHNLSAVVLTHGHCDHISGCDPFAAAGVPIYVGKADLAMLSDSARNLSAFTGGSYTMDSSKVNILSEGDVICFGEAELRVIELPGHSPGGIGLYGDGVLFAGDQLFASGVGRCDLPGGDSQLLTQSILEKLYCLPDETVVYPGHGPATTIGMEKRENPFVRA